jgi:hypothetical protein
MSRITFQKRQKEMKRQEKQRAKAERRAQKKLAKRAGLATESDDRATPSPSDDISSEQGSG